jgi:multiple sugar transport system ATP-binding protein
MAEIEFDDIGKRYADGFEAVKHMNLDVPDGELMILVGPSGCGKSTALRMVAGLEDISSGQLKIGGNVVNDRAPKDRDIAMVFQNYALYPHMTVRENMGFALKLAKVAQGEIDQKVNEAAKILDLEQHLDRKPANLSGGQRQRVAMGRAIVRQPSVFLMDEPLSNLDAKLRVQMRTEISRIQQRLGTTTIYVTHDQTEAMTLGDRITVMRAGELQQVGPPSELYGHPNNLFVAGFIGSPSMNFLSGEISGENVHLPIGDVRIPDELRRRLESGPGGGRRGVVAGLRPEHFEDAALVADRARGVTFKARIDVLESMGSEFYAYFVVESEQIASRELEELAADAGGADLPGTEGGVQITVRLGAESKVRQGAESELWFDSSHLQLFDAESGQSLLARDGAAQTAQAPAPTGTPTST